MICARRHMLDDIAARRLFTPPKAMQATIEGGLVEGCHQQSRADGALLMPWPCRIDLPMAAPHL
jgi:hypothetical protein